MHRDFASSLFLSMGGFTPPGSSPTNRAVWRDVHAGIDTVLEDKVRGQRSPGWISLGDIAVAFWTRRHVVSEGVGYILTDLGRMM